MARDGTKTGGKNFKPGQGGRKPGAVSIPKEIRSLNRKEAEEKFSKYLAMDQKELEKCVKDKSLPSMDAMIVKVISEAIKKGDYTRFSFILDRTIGKVTEKLDLSSTDGTMIPQINVTLPSNKREKKQIK